MEVFNLDIIPGKSVPVIHASQYDIGRQFRANLFEGSSVFTLDGTETVSVYVSKPDGNMVTESVTNTSSNYVVIETTEQMTACEGANLCELRIEKGGNRIGTLNFILECEKSPDTGITSQTEINNLETLVDGFTALAVADQYDSANVIFDNTPTAGHGNGYAVTSDGIKTVLAPLTATSITITKGATMPPSFPTPTVSRRGNVCIVIFAIQMPAGTYTSDDTLWNITPVPIANSRCMVSFSANPNKFTNINLLTSGRIAFNGTQTVDSDSWLIGQAVYLTDG